MAFKIAYGAGHYYDEPGRRIPAALNAKQTREWELNDRIARYFAEAAALYEDVALLRTDDPTGEEDPGLRERCKCANAFEAEVALSIHHNAGANLTRAGGIVAYSYYGSERGAAYRDSIYDACIAAGGLKGNRAEPKQEAGFYVLKYTAMPCVLMEYGFMDSMTDAQVILEDAYAKRMAYATMEGIAKVAGLKKREPAIQEEAYTLAQFIRDVQRNTGSEVDGIAGPETIRNTPTLSAGENRMHPAVVCVQKWLYTLGYVEVGKADGIAGAKFDASVRAFQRDNGCIADGEITAGNKTWRKLLKME